MIEVITGIWTDRDLAGDDAERTLHVYPNYGRAHEVDGARCWCSPQTEDYRPTGKLLVIHREEN